MKIVPLQSLASKVSQSAGENKYPVLSITAGVGFVKQTEKFGKEIAGAQYVHYTVLKKGDFSYNKGNSKTCPQGCIYRQDDEEYAAVPNVFNSFRFTSPDCETTYYKYLFESGYLNRQLCRLINYGVRNDGLLNIYDEDFYGCKVPCPPLEEQKRIAEILECCDKVIRLKRELIEEKKNQKKSLMQKLLDPNSGFRLPGFNGEWDIVTLRDVCLSNGQYGMNAPAVFGQPDLPMYMRITDISDKEKYVNADDARVQTTECDKYLLHENDVVFVRTGGTVGKKYFYSLSDGKLVFAGFLIRFSIDKTKINVSFLKSVLNTSKYWKWVATMSQRSGQPGINAEEYGAYSFPIPTLNEQKEIGKILSTADHELDLLEQDLTQWEQKKKSLMQLLFMGKVKV